MRSNERLNVGRFAVDQDLLVRPEPTNQQAPKGISGARLNDYEIRFGKFGRRSAVSGRMVFGNLQEFSRAHFLKQIRLLAAELIHVFVQEYPVQDELAWSRRQEKDGFNLVGKVPNESFQFPGTTDTAVEMAFEGGKLHRGLPLGLSKTKQVCRGDKSLGDAMSHAIPPIAAHVPDFAAEALNVMLQRGEFVAGEFEFRGHLDQSFLVIVDIGRGNGHPICAWIAFAHVRL